MNQSDLLSTELNEIQNHNDFIVIWISLDDVPKELKNCGENHPKLVNIFENIGELSDRLRKDILLIDRSDLPISISSINEITIEKSLMNLHRNTLMFLWNQLFIYYLIKSPNINMDKLKKDMLEQCKFEYNNDQRELDKINDFDENCSSDTVLKWYTKDSFLYRLLNKAFRTQNLELICKFQYFIIRLYNKFQDLSKEEHNNPSIVYRGQMLDENTLNNLKSNIGRLISMNTFISTSRNEAVARSFISGAPNAVIFKINLQDQIYNSFKPFIDISKFSSNRDEEEILFFIGTVFQIDSVEQKDDDPTWIIELTLKNEISKHIANVIPEFQNRIFFLQFLHPLFMKTDDFNMIDKYYSILTNEIFSSKNSPTIMMYIHLAFTLSNLGVYEKAIEVYKEAISINENPIDSHGLIVLHIIIGYLYYHSSKYDDAFTPYGIALSLLDENNLLTSELYSHIGDVWNKMKNEDIALSCYKEALKIASHQDFPSLPNIYRNIIEILEKKGNSEEVSVYKEQAKEIDQSQYHILESTFHDQKLLEKFKDQLNKNSNLTSIQRADLLYKIGLYLMVQGDFKQALENLLEAKELFMKEPPPQHRFSRHLATLFDNIASLYLFHGDYLRALITWKKGIHIRITCDSH